MKRENLFMVNLDRDDASIDREEFILRRESAAVRIDRAALDDRLGKAIMKSAVGVHNVMKLFFFLSLVAAVCCGVVTLYNYFDIGVFTHSYIMVIFFVLSGVFGVLQKVFNKKNEKNNPIDSLDDEYGRLNEISKRDLRIPSDAMTVELFGRFYHKDSTPDEPYDVDEMTVFEEDGNLCLHHTGVVIAIPTDSIEAVVKRGDTITFSDWTKDVPHDSDEYMQYNITKREIDEYDEEYSMNGYYSIRFSKDGTPFELLVPLYEIAPFLDILKLEVTEE